MPAARIWPRSSATRFAEAAKTLRELFARLVGNMNDPQPNATRYSWRTRGNAHWLVQLHRASAGDPVLQVGEECGLSFYNWERIVNMCSVATASASIPRRSRKSS